MTRNNPSSASTGLPPPPPPPLPTNDILACQFSSWYSTFRQKTLKLTPKSIILPLSPSFLQYLLSDGIRLPSCCEENDSDDASFSSCSEVENLEHEEEEEVATEVHSFPQLTRSISDALTALGGTAFPKLNWSSPKDASWINGGTLKCTSPKDVYLLLKSSDFIVHDLEHALPPSFSSSEKMEYYLVLRKWCNLHPSMEFRCFIRNQTLIAICQRHASQYYPHLRSSRSQIVSTIRNSFERQIKPNFRHVSNYVVDCYIDTKSKVWIIDFNIWHAQTDGLLFTWEELETASDDDELEVRLVQGEKEVRHDPLSSYRAPIDCVSLVNGVGGEEFEEFRTMCETRNNTTSSE